MYLEDYEDDPVGRALARVISAVATVRQELGTQVESQQRRITHLENSRSSRDADVATLRNLLSQCLPYLPEGLDLRDHVAAELDP